MSDHIETTSNLILDSCKIKNLPVPIDEIALARGLKLKPYDMGEEISGVLLIEGDKSTIGYNTRESEARQRFTIAHELGHYELHKSKHELFIDKKIPIVFYRDQNSSKGDNQMEQEANAFAASILMPIPFIKREIQKGNIKSFDENALMELSKIFNVSLAAMTIRISNVMSKL
jgi:Zn-dependent peptidase ImmA (M78 family)